MKAILVIDMPKCCGETPCPCWNEDDRKDWCGATNMTLTGCDIEKERPSWCPLKPMPTKKEHSEEDNPYSGNYEDEYEYQYREGYNTCIREITGETE